MVTHFSGLASTRCPIVTKLVSWLDMNHARDDTLHRHRKNQDKVPNSNASYGKNLAYQITLPENAHSQFKLLMLLTNMHNQVM
jgi:hypothetical protein